MKVMARGGRRPGAGRPKKDPADVASVYIPIHMTPAQRDICQLAADADKMDLSPWAKEHLLAIAARRLRK